MKKIILAAIATAFLMAGTVVATHYTADTAKVAAQPGEDG
jgi:hypothetical protein